MSLSYLVEQHWNMIERYDGGRRRYRHGYVEWYYKRHPDHYTRRKILDITFADDPKANRRIRRHVIRHLEKDPRIRSEIYARKVGIAKLVTGRKPRPPAPMPEILPPTPAVVREPRRLDLRTIHVPRKRYFRRERVLIAGFGYQTVEKAHYTKAYSYQKDFTYLQRRSPKKRRP